MDFYLGIDGGGTRTRATLRSLDGSVRASGEAGPSNPHYVGFEAASTALRAAFLQALDAEPTRCAHVVSAFLGVAGAGSPDTRDKLLEAVTGWPELRAARITVDHDLRTAWAGALEGAPGIIVIAGTGSAAYGCSANGQDARAGGWGALIDDVGGGYWLGVELLKAAARAHDGRGPATLLKEAAQRALALENFDRLGSALVSPALTREKIAALAPRVIEAAAAGDEVALALLHRGADELAQLVRAVHVRLFAGAAVPVSALGGLLDSGAYATAVQAALADRAPNVFWRTASGTALHGAVLLAARQLTSE